MLDKERAIKMVTGEAIRQDREKVEFDNTIVWTNEDIKQELQDFKDQIEEYYQEGEEGETIRAILNDFNERFEDLELE